MIFGYARVSTKEQNIDLQVQELKKFGCDEIILEHSSGVGKQENLSLLLNKLRGGDTLVVWKTDRLGRRFTKLVELMDHLERNNIDIVSITQGIDTRTKTGKLIFYIFSLIAENERDLIIERTNAGLEAAKARGVKLGRKPIDKSIKEKAIKMYETRLATGFSVKQITDTFGISRATLYKWVNEEIKRK